jgi:hypothetical protein
MKKNLISAFLILLNILEQQGKAVQVNHPPVLANSKSDI